jgi:hypothetical protein
MQFKITDLLFLSLATLAAADCDGDDCSTTTTAVNAASTTADANGPVITNLISSTDVIKSSSLVPVLTPDVETTTDVDVNTNRQTISETTDVGTTPTNTIDQLGGQHDRDLHRR